MSDITKIWESLALDHGGKIVYLVLDGIGGIQDPHRGVTELQAANKPHLDALAKKSSCGLLDIVGAGVTPGSGPGHLALFGYQPLEYNIGRGIFSALGIDFKLREGDVAARFNFCSVDKGGNITDRRAGRISTDVNEKLCEKLRIGLNLGDVKVFIQTESEHRGFLALRGTGLGGEITDTDPGELHVKPLEPKALNENSKRTAELLTQVIKHAAEVLKEEHPANMILLRGIEKYHPVRGLKERFLLDGLCIAEYPMYKGVSRFLGMDVRSSTGGMQGIVKNLKETFNDGHNFYFLHFKNTDKAGEDGDFEKKIKAIEEVDKYIRGIMELNPDVLVVTGDHSTPSAMGVHSWHPVPVLIHSKNARIDRVDRFDEISCIYGALGQRPAVDLMGLSLAHAGRLKKFGA
jgi:2,3-bisphosphoglycerate-independent phosphoglycerate mutase